MDKPPEKAKRKPRHRDKDKPAKADKPEKSSEAKPPGKKKGSWATWQGQATPAQGHSSQPLPRGPRPQGPRTPLPYVAGPGRGTFQPPPPPGQHRPMSGAPRPQLPHIPMPPTQTPHNGPRPRYGQPPPPHYAGGQRQGHPGHPAAPAHAPFPCHRPYYANWMAFEPQLKASLNYQAMARRRPEPDWSDPEVARPSPLNGPPKNALKHLNGRLGSGVSVCEEASAEAEAAEDEEDGTGTSDADDALDTTEDDLPTSPAKPPTSRLTPSAAKGPTQASGTPTGGPKGPPRTPSGGAAASGPPGTPGTPGAPSRAPPASGEPKFAQHMSAEEVAKGLADGRLIEGPLRINQRNYEEAFVDNPAGSSEPDVVIKGMRERNRAFHGDRVAVLLKPKEQWTKNQDGVLVPAGQVVAVTEMRHSRQAVGHLKPMTGPIGRHYGIFSPRDSRVPRIMIPIEDLPTGFARRPQDFEHFIYIGKTEEWGLHSMMPVGRLVKELGEAGDVHAETEGLLIEYEIDEREFDQDVLDSLPEVAEGCEWEIPAEELGQRRDFRDELVFTIDPKTARDLDDALHCRPLDDGTFEVGVHIADVAYFVETGTAVDLWASQRCTSTYLVDRVVPMLPRLLCERLCSLNPNVDRLAFSVVWKMSPEGEVLEEWFGRSVIRSVAKLSYDVAQGFIEEPEREWDESEIPFLSEGIEPREVRDATNRLNFLAGKLRAARYKEGALRLDQPKLSFALNDDMTAPIGCVVYKIRDSNRLVEEWMLKANMAVAQRISAHFPKLAILRNHPPPKGRILQETLKLCASLGYPLSGRSSAALAASLVRYAGHGENAAAVFAVISALCMRPMQLAQYFCTGDVADEGAWRHYALSVDQYTHFTSPIRRYPDLMVHRLLAASLRPELESGLTSHDVKHLRELCKRCNEKKLDAKTVGEKSAEMFFALFVNRCGPLDEPAVVLGVMDFSIDLLLTRIGLTRRVYFKPQLPDMVVSYEYAEGPPPTMKVEWRHPETGKVVEKTYSITDIASLRLEKGSKPLEFSSRLLPPSELGVESEAGGVPDVLPPDAPVLAEPLDDGGD